MRCMVLSLCLLIMPLLGVAPAYSEAPAEPASMMAATTLDKVNINTANAQTLAEKLTGIGEARAGDIVRYRETYGSFVSADELAEVKGIGQSTVDRNRDVITLE
ncbi:MAG: ComEA family DNA-binding protein [Halieaceae bacterium]|nr:ComEA family DNA-binding protein [Halieaceae bacterium]MCP4466982.1 ComEA family DNA-binding protein [Halieaceae bacterium]